MRFWPIWLIAGAMLATVAAILFATDTGAYLRDSRRMVKQYYIPSEAMLPTLEVKDRIMPRRLEPADIRRGTVVVLRVGEQTWVKRIAAVAGDTIQMREGVVILNGKPVAQRPDGEQPPSPQGATVAKFVGTEIRPSMRFIEQFPGEPRPHRILDEGFGPQDNSEVYVVPTGHVFMLGDNRDNSADSRLPKRNDDFGGLGMVPITDIIGVVDFILYSQRFGFGQPIDNWGAPGQR